MTSHKRTLGGSVRAGATLRYRIWRDYVPGHEYAFAHRLTGLSYEQIYDVCEGARLTAPPKAVHVTRLWGTVLPDVMSTAWGGRLVGAAAKTILEEYCGADELQFVPAVIDELDDGADTFWLLNVLATVDCLDERHSQLKRFEEPPHTIETVTTLAVRPPAGDAPPLFHVGELTYALLIRDDLQAALENGTSTPGHFSPVHEFTYGL